MINHTVGLFQTFTQLFQFLNGIMAVIFCGHLGKYELGAVALAISVSILVVFKQFLLDNMSLTICSLHQTRLSPHCCWPNIAITFI